MLRSSWGRVAPAMICNEVQLSSRALLSFNFSLLVPHICMPIRHEHTHILWPTCSTQGAARWHLNDIQGFTSSTLPCSVPIRPAALGRRQHLSLSPALPPPCPVTLHCSWAPRCHRSRNKIHFVLAKETCKRRREERAGRAEAHRYLWAAVTAGVTGPESLIENSSHNIWKKICPLHGKSMALNWALQAEKGRAENRSITSSVWTNLGKSLNPDWAQHTIKLCSWREAPGCSPNSPLSLQFSARVQSSAWSPFKEVAINGRKPLQGDRGGGPSNNLGSNCNRSRFLRRLPALIDEVQVAVHPGHLVGREGVGAVIVWN